MEFGGEAREKIDADYTSVAGFILGLSNTGADDGDYCANAAVPLPDGAVVSSMEAVLSDASAADDMDISLFFLDSVLPDFDTMATVSSTGSAGGIETVSTTTITDPTVDLAARFYYLFVCPPVDTALFGVRVFH